MRFPTMKLFRRSKNKQAPAQAQAQAQFNYDRDPRYAQPDTSYSSGYIPAGFAPWLQLPGPILQRVFAFVCPQSLDESYETNEQSCLDDVCPLCDLRDLAHAGMVCKRWRRNAIPILYRSIRIDACHFCPREIYLSETRKRTSRWDRNGIPEDTASVRLRLLCRTLRDDPTRLGILVEYLKLPYMLRESQAADIARTIAVLPKLRYVDLPEGVFTDEPSRATLKLEVQARCPDLRKMTYKGGSERSLEALGTGNVWRNLEVLELVKISMNPAILRYVLSALGNLRALKVSETTMLDDDIFRSNDVFPAVPALEELILTGTLRVTAHGLVAYLSRKDTQMRLKVLSLVETRVRPQDLQAILANAPRLEALSIVEEVDTAFPALNSPIQLLASDSLQTLRYEITTSDKSPYKGISQAYYTYLARSLFAGGLSRLTALYVRDQNFPDMLLGLPPLTPGFSGDFGRPSSSNSAAMFSMGSDGLSPIAGGMPLTPAVATGQSSRFSSNNPFAAPQRNLGLAGNGLGPAMLSLNQTLEIFTKGDEEETWGSIMMDPIDNPGYAGGHGVRNSTLAHGRSSSTSSATRPLSSYGLADAGAGWTQGVPGTRKSIMVGNGFGGFLSVPSEREGSGRRRVSTGGADEWPRPMSRKEEKDALDLWR